MNAMIKPSRRTFVKSVAGASAATVFGVPMLLRADDAKLKLKFATLAPTGSTWYKALKIVARKIKEKTDGECQIKLYGGGVMGDEGAMIRKLRTGQLDGAAVTSVGMGKISKQLLMLQLPLLFRHSKDLDRVRDAMSEKFEKLLFDGGVKLLGWGDVGPIYLFSNTPIARPADARATKMWRWDTDPVGKEIMKVGGINAVPLGVPDVLPSLSTGIIDAVTAAPYGLIALQWHTHLQYVTNLKFAMGVGGSVMDNKAWDKAAPYHDVFKHVTDETLKKLLRSIRKANDKATKALVGADMKVVEPEAMEEWHALAGKVRKNLTGTLFKEEIIGQMMGEIAKL